jgi:hypothetical protein
MHTLQLTCNTTALYSSQALLAQCLHAALAAAPPISSSSLDETSYYSQKSCLAWLAPLVYYSRTLLDAEARMSDCSTVAAYTMPPLLPGGT